MTENQLRQKIVDQAKSWLGRKESDGTHGEIVDVYNSITPLPRGYRVTYKDPWCATFVSACAQVWGLTGIVYAECSCPKMIQLYKDHGRWMENDAYVPQPGDIIFYDWEDDGKGDDTGTSDHVGIVVGVSGRTITIIEGNCSDAVKYTNRTVDGKYIRGFGLPDYASMADGEEEPEPELEPTECTVTLPILQIGDGMDRNYELADAVQAAQYLLKNRGYSVGWMGCDGEFGQKTESAVGKFQGDYGIEKTGIIDQATWTALICGR